MLKYGKFVTLPFFKKICISEVARGWKEIAESLYYLKKSKITLETIGLGDSVHGDQ